MSVQDKRPGRPRLADAEPDAMLVDLKDEFDNDLLAAVQDGGYDVCVREICDAFHCSRATVHRDFRPCVHHVYAPRRMAFACLGGTGGGYDLRGGGVLYKRSELDALVRSGSVTRRTVVVHPERFLDGAARVEFERSVERIEMNRDLADDIRDGTTRKVLVDRYGSESYELVDAALRFVSCVWDGIPCSDAVVAARERFLARGGVPWVDCGDAAPAGIEELRLRWGTSTGIRESEGIVGEMLQRWVWKTGARRLEVSTPCGFVRRFYDSFPGLEARWPSSAPALVCDMSDGCLNATL